MTRKQWMRDFREVDEIVTKSGDVLRYAPDISMTMRMIHFLAVAVWHLLDDKLRGINENESS